MSHIQDLSLDKLRNDVHQALKLWPAPNDDTSPLSYLLLYKQTLQSKSINARLATSQILDQALSELEAKYGSREAGLLRMRFFEDTPMHQVARALHVAESWANKQQRQAINHLADILIGLETQAREAHRAALSERLDLPPSTQLFGVEPILDNLLNAVSAPGQPWLLAVEGLGGIGKTALAARLIQEVGPTGRFADVAWVTAKQEDFLPGAGLRRSDRPALDIDTLTDSLLKQLAGEEFRTGPSQQRRFALSKLLKSQPYLVVVDNLETVIDYEALLPLLQRLADPTKFLLTSRYMQTSADVSRFTITELSQADTISFLKYEAEARRSLPLASATEAQLKNIFEIVGGNPLALKLVVGQVSALPLSHVLEGLKQAQGRKVEELYTYIYSQAWRTLEPASRQALLAMPLAQNGSLDQLLAASRLELSELHQALEQLLSLSLLETSGDIEHRRYRIHRLTETFLLHEVARWPSSP